MIKDFFDGIGGYGKAIAHLFRHGGWLYVFLPGLLCLLVGGSMFWLSWKMADNVGNVLDNLWRWEWGKTVVAKIADVFGGVLVLAFGLVIIRQLLMIITSPFMSLLSERVENQITGRKNGAGFSLPRMMSDMLRGLRIALRNMWKELLFSLLLLLLGLFPLFSPFAVAGIFLVQAYYAGFGNLDFALERRYRYRDSVAFVQRHRGLAIGNGAVFLLLLFTFIGFLVANPLSTIAATINTNDKWLNG